MHPIAKDGGSAENCLQQFRPGPLCCSSVGHDCSRQSFGTPAIPGGRILKGILFTSRLAGAALQHPRCCILYFDPGP